MKKILIGLFLLTSFSSFAADKEKARNITNQLNQWVEAQKSTTPNAAILYLSNSANVDDTSVVTAIPLLDNVISDDGKITIQRPTQERLALTRCNADFGTVQVFNDGNPRLVVSTTKLPVRVFCATDDGKRAFYTTVNDPTVN